MNIETARRGPHSRPTWSPWACRWQPSDSGPRPVAGAGVVAGAAVPAAVDPEWCKRHGFSAKVGQTLIAPGARESGRQDPRSSWSGWAPPAMLAGDRGLESLRRAAAAFVRCRGPGGHGRPRCCPPAPISTAGRSAAAVAEGAVLASYRYDAFRTGDVPGPWPRWPSSPASADDGRAVGAGAARGARLAASVGLARDLVNEPPSSLTPERFAGIFVERFSGVDGVTVEVWDEERIAAERLGGLLGVARGSAQPPRLVRVEYRPADPSRSTAGCPIWRWWARGSPSTPAACRSRRRPAWRP